MSLSKEPKIILIVSVYKYFAPPALQARQAKLIIGAGNLLSNKSTNLQALSVGYDRNSSSLSRRHHFRAARAPTLDDLFVRMPED